MNTCPVPSLLPIQWHGQDDRSDPIEGLIMSAVKLKRSSRTHALCGHEPRGSSVMRRLFDHHCSAQVLVLPTGLAQNGLDLPCCPAGRVHQTFNIQAKLQYDLSAFRFVLRFACFVERSSLFSCFLRLLRSLQVLQRNTPLSLSAWHMNNDLAGLLVAFSIPTPAGQVLDCGQAPLRKLQGTINSTVPHHALATSDVFPTFQFSRILPAWTLWPSDHGRYGSLQYHISQWQASIRSPQRSGLSTTMGAPRCISSPIHDSRFATIDTGGTTCPPIALGH